MVYIGNALLAVVALASAVRGSSVCDYYSKQCTGVCNKSQEGATPTRCNSQQGASFGYTLDRPCTLRLFRDGNFQNLAYDAGRADRGCVDFSGTSGSWQFLC
ncbi:hypothetical protein PG990_010899 [Apiospora arundinis]